jgi:hypothetical protein
MQTESGEDLSQIFQRKELERLAGGGLFLWGIGNSLRVPTQWSAEEKIPVIFSRMVSKAKEVDVRPGSVLVWRKFFLPGGALQRLPAHALVTSRAYTSSGPKLTHYALVCRSSNPIGTGKARPFDPSAYRNMGGDRRPIGFSQVTALVQRTGVESKQSRYAIDLEAVLVSPFVLKLADPLMIEGGQISGPEGPAKPDDWLKFVADLRADRVN